MRRLYSTFAAGWPGAGLLLMRMVVGCALLARESATLESDAGTHATILAGCAVVCGILLLPGLWTPIAATAVAFIQIWQMLTLTGERWVALLLGTICGALAMLGPGLWSVDACLFGWKRIVAPPRKKTF